ncbi:MAG: DUF364 domain-containing protein [Thermoleophilia bacterium]|nr:DUF364 domain-containing protein [Thermoleophilia bacterium]
MIIDDLRNALLASYKEQRIADVRIGLGYTGVMLENGDVGVAYTFRENAAAGCSVFMGKRPLAGRTTTEILEYLGSSEGVESTVGLAVANALANHPGPDQHEGDILSVLSIGFMDRVGMVGYFGPLVAPLEKRVRELVIFELNAGRSDRVLPAEAAYEELPRCDVAIITSTALILGDMDRLLEAAAKCREVALVGASTPLVPAVFSQAGAKLLSGIIVSDGPGILQIVSEGGGMGFFGQRIRKVNVRP